VACDPDKQSGPRCIEVPFFVAPRNGEHAWQCLDYTCGVTVAFLWMEARMQVIVERCAWFDVHQEAVVACVLIGAPGERPRKQVRGIVRLNSMLRAGASGWGGPLFLLTNRQRVRRDSTQKMAYTNLP
jgi:hypothetical protein